MMTPTVIEELYTALLRYQQAVDRNAGIATEKERVKNFLFHYRNEIYEALSTSEEGAEQLAELKEEVAVKEKMIADLTKKVNEMKKKMPPADKG